MNRIRPVPKLLLLAAALLGLVSGVLPMRVAVRAATASVRTEAPVRVSEPGLEPGAAVVAEPGLFGLTNLVDLRLEIAAADWDRMLSSGGPASRRSQEWGGGLVSRGGVQRGLVEEGKGLWESLWQRFLGGAPAAPGPEKEKGGGESITGQSSGGYPWAPCTVRCGGRVLRNVAVRFKGASSMVRAPNAYKRPFKLDFNRASPGRRFFGVRALYLGNNVNDATQMREALAYELFRRAGVPAPRTGFARVTLTIPGRVENRMVGLYTLVEAVDDDFLERHFGVRDGLLMKPERMAGLAYFGENWDAYRERYRPDEPKEGVPADQSAAVIGFARWLNRTPPDGFAGGLGRWVDPESFARFVAMNAIQANVDSFLGNGHNYYLHLHPRTKRLTFVPWDLNESFGVHPVSGPSRTQMRTSVLRPTGDPNRLVDQFVVDPDLGALYRAQCAMLLTNVFVPERLAGDIDRIAAVTGPVVFAESRRARQEFERTVLGVPPADPSPATQPRHDREGGTEGYRPWGFPSGVEIDHLPLKEWIAGRAAQVRAELEGRARGLHPRPRF